MGKHSTPNTGRMFRPTDEQRKQVLMMTGFGINQDDIALMIQISKPTLHKHFRRELDTGLTEANLRVVQSLYTNATKNMSVQAQIWWTKARMGWKDSSELNIGGTQTPLMIITGVVRDADTGQGERSGTRELDVYSPARGSAD